LAYAIQAEIPPPETVLEWFLAAGRKGPQYAIGLVIVVAALTLSFYHLFVAYAGALEAHTFRSTHLTLIMVLAFLLNPLGRKSWRSPLNAWFLIDCLCIALIVAIEIYTIYDIDAFILRRGDLTDWDLRIGTIFLVLLLEATRRTVGWAMVIIASFFIAHTAFSNYFPGIFFGPPASWFTIIDYVFMRENGIFGIPLMVMATYIYLFILFGSLLVGSGAGRFFINVALALTGHRVGGPAKASVVSSAIMATVSGSAVANVVTTGSFTIPLMKRIGYRAAFAGAVEACASSGGQIMPPVMGAAAFIIAEFMNVPYLHVALAALVPAVLYFFSIFMQVHMEARKRNLSTISRDELPQFWHEVKRGGHLFLSIIIIIGLLVLGYTPMLAGFWAIVSVFALSFLRPETRMTPVRLLAAMEDGARKSIPVSIACATAGIIIGCVFVSGVGLKFTNLIVTIAAGRLWIALILTMFASLILGMGLTTTAVYITVAALVVPSLTQMGAVPIAAHLFAFYFGLVSAITPPVALASFAASGIADSNPMQTGIQSFLIGLAKYVIPIVFIYNPGILIVGDAYHIVWGIAGGFLGIFSLTLTVVGFLYVRMSWLGRVLAAASAVLLFHPSATSDFGGVVGLALLVGYYYFKSKRLPQEEPG
jgi:TRAP transporter 4TM/12TM fusion protein